MTRPRITKEILDGIITATSLYLADPPDCGCESGPEFDEQEKDLRAVEAADYWARTTRESRGK